MSPQGNYYVMCSYSLILIMHAQFGIPNSTKKFKLNYKIFIKKNYFSAFNLIIELMLEQKSSFLAPLVWNNLPNELKRTNLNMFKHKIKEYFSYKTEREVTTELLSLQPPGFYFRKVMHLGIRCFVKKCSF